MRLKHMNHKRISRIMIKYDLTAKIRRRNPYKEIMKKTMEHRIFPNLLQRDFHQVLPYNVFCTDITYLKIRIGFVYLSVIKDVATGEIVAWNLSLRLDMTLVTDTVRNMNLKSCDDIMIHSDQGFHYTNPGYIALLAELHMIQSMSNKGNCIDNSPVEYRNHLLAKN